MNFKMTVMISDQDLVSTGPASDTIGISDSPTLNPPSTAQAGLLLGAKLKVKGDVTLTVPAADCSIARWFCIHVTPGEAIFSVNSVRNPL